MFFKDRPLITVLLLVIIISFAFLASARSYPSIIEGNTNKSDTDEDDDDDEDDEEDDVPDCAGDVPGCYSTLVYSTTNGAYTPAYLDDDFILKTEIVPPVCPACPSVINQHSHDGSTNGNDSLSGSEISSNEVSTETNITNITNEENVTTTYNEDVGISGEVNASTSETSDETETETTEKTESSDSNDATKQQDTTNQLGSVMNDISSFTVSGSSPNQNDSSRLQEYEKQISELKGKLTALQQKSGASGN